MYSREQVLQADYSGIRILSYRAIRSYNGQPVLFGIIAGPLNTISM